MISYASFLDRKLIPDVEHTLTKNSYADLIWSKNNIRIFVHENMAMLTAAPNRIFALGIQPKMLYAFDSVTGELVWEQKGELPDTIAANNSVFIHLPQPTFRHTIY